MKVKKDVLEKLIVVIEGFPLNIDHNSDEEYDQMVDLATYVIGLIVNDETIEVVE